MTYHFHWFCEQVGLAGDLGSTNNVLIPFGKDHDSGLLVHKVPLRSMLYADVFNCNRTGVSSVSVQDRHLRMRFLYLAAMLLVGGVEEVDINKKTENQAKMTKLSMEWKRLCKIKAKVQKCQSQSQYRRISSQTGAGTEEYYWMQS
ncbi:hypothetical protein Tco_1563009 [Tanacetum coccineum]